MSVTKARSRLAVEAKRYKREPTPELARTVEVARRDLAAAKLAAYIEAVVRAAPPLTAEQRSRLSALFGGPA